MRRSQLCLVLAITGVLLWVGSPALGASDEEPERRDYYLAGVELGGTGALAPLDRYVNNGAVLAPFGGYMFNNFIGAMGQLHVLALPNQDSSDDLLEDDATWALGATVGPRMALPMGGIEVWGTVQGGIFAGLSPHSPITSTSPAFSAGGGVNIDISDSLSFGGFARYNRIYEDVHGRGDARYASGGISLTYKMAPPKPAPPPK